MFITCSFVRFNYAMDNSSQGLRHCYRLRSEGSRTWKRGSEGSSRGLPIASLLPRPPRLHRLHRSRGLRSIDGEIVDVRGEPPFRHPSDPYSL